MMTRRKMRSDPEPFCLSFGVFRAVSSLSPLFKAESEVCVGRDPEGYGARAG